MSWGGGALFSACDQTPLSYSLMENLGGPGTFHWLIWVDIGCHKNSFFFSTLMDFFMLLFYLLFFCYFFCKSVHVYGFYETLYKLGCGLCMSFFGNYPHLKKKKIKQVIAHVLDMPIHDFMIAMWFLHGDCENWNFAPELCVFSTWDVMKCCCTLGHW